MTTEASGAGAPKCKICQQNHWLRVGCDGKPQGTLAAKPVTPPPPIPPAPKATKRRKKKKRAKRGARKT